MNTALIPYNLENALRTEYTYAIGLYHDLRSSIHLDPDCSYEEARERWQLAKAAREHAITLYSEIKELRNEHQYS